MIGWLLRSAAVLHDPTHQRVRSRRIGMDGAGHQSVDDLVRHVRVRFRGRGGNGFQLAIVLTQRLAAALSVIPGKCRRSSIAADSSPLSSNTRRMASAVASSTLNMAQAWGTELQRTSRRPTMSAEEKGPGRGLKSCRGHSPIWSASPGWRNRERPPRWHSEGGIRASADQRMACRGFQRSAHRSNAAMRYYHSANVGPSTAPSKPDISPDQRWGIPMKKMILAVFTALSLTAAIAPLASAASVHSGPYDNTANSLGGRNAGTFGGN